MGMTLEEFQGFEEAEMMREFERMNVEHRGDPRLQAGGPRMPMMMMRGGGGKVGGGRDLMPNMEAMMMMMGPQGGVVGGPQAWHDDGKAWESAYAEALHGGAPQQEQQDAQMFDRFEREFGRPSHGRPHPHHPQHAHFLQSQAPPPPSSSTISSATTAATLTHQRPKDWAQEFDQDEGNKFAEFEQIYRTSSPSLSSSSGQQLLASGGDGEDVRDDEGWVKDFEQEHGDELKQRSSADVGEDATFDPAIAKENSILASQIASIQDPKFRQSELFKMMTALSDGEIAFQGDKVVPLPPDQREAMNRASVVPQREKWASEFEAEQQLTEEELGRPGGVWQREFEDFFPRSGAKDADDAAFDQADIGTAPWSKAMAEEFDKKFGASWAKEFEASLVDGDVPPLGEGYWEDGSEFGTSSQKQAEYKLAEQNEFDGDSQAFERGRSLFKAGRLTEAIEAFEAAVKQNPEHSLAWQMLGATQAENDRDDLAALALVKAIQTDPNNRDALITLSVSYTNDFHKYRALECLQQWLITSTEYQSINADVPLSRNFDQNHEIITNLFIQAARMRPHDPDPDVQVALGLLYNLTFEYEKAIDCFKAAARKRPDDYLIWNKLGATQANAKMSEDAIDSFIRALEIKPSYTRACSNLGISFMALNEYGEAAKAFLSALALNPNAHHQWDNLKNVFSLMSRPDLIRKCDTKDISLFQDEFHF